MSEDLSTAYKIAASVVVMAFILSMGLTLMFVGRHFWNTTAENITKPVTSVVDTDAYFLSAYHKPVPIASIWKLVQRINVDTRGSASNPNGNFTEFAIMEQSITNPTTPVLLSESIEDLDIYMNRKAYMSWDMDESTGLYSMEVVLVR